MKSFWKLNLFLALCLVPTAGAHAGAWNTNPDNVVLDGYDVVAYFNAAKAVRGRANLSATHDGATFHFSSAENRKAFRRQPEKYLPKFGGFCAFGVAANKMKVPVDPETFKIYNGEQVTTGEEEQVSWLAKASQLAAAESMAGQQGASVVVDRLAEALLIQTLRLFLSQSQEPRGFLAAVRDPMIGRALLSLHDNPDQDWSVDKLAREASLSRSAFAEHFRRLVGEPPMRYLAQWRMLAARRLLKGGSLSTAEVARRVGYQDEFAFAKAFKRFFDMGPGAARRSA